MGHAANVLKGGDLQALARFCLDVRLFPQPLVYLFEPDPITSNAPRQSPGHTKPAMSFG